MNVPVVLQGPPYGVGRCRRVRRTVTPSRLARFPASRITDDLIIEHTHRSNLDQCTDWALWADKTINF